MQKDIIWPVIVAKAAPVIPILNIKINIWSTSMLHTTVPTVLPKDTATEYSLLLVWVGVSPKNRSSRITFLSSNY
mgnify:CR=1 FL=1